MSLLRLIRLRFTNAPAREQHARVVSERTLSYSFLRSLASFQPNTFLAIARRADLGAESKRLVAQAALELLPRTVTGGRVDATQALTMALHAAQPLGPWEATLLNRAVQEVAGLPYIIDYARTFCPDATLARAAAYEFAAHALRLHALTTKHVDLCWRIVWDLHTSVGRTSLAEIETWCIEHPNATNDLRLALALDSPTSHTHLHLARCSDARKDSRIVLLIFSKGINAEAMAEIVQVTEGKKFEDLFTLLLGRPDAIFNGLSHLESRLRELPEHLIVQLLTHENPEVRLRAITAFGARIPDPSVTRRLE